jgi:hypothetical protein
MSKKAMNINKMLVTLLSAVIKKVRNSHNL